MLANATNPTANAAARRQKNMDLISFPMNGYVDADTENQSQCKIDTRVGVSSAARRRVMGRRWLLGKKVSRCRHASKAEARVRTTRRRQGLRAGRRARRTTL